MIVLIDVLMGMVSRGCPLYSLTIFKTWKKWIFSCLCRCVSNKSSHDVYF